MGAHGRGRKHRSPLTIHERNSCMPKYHFQLKNCTTYEFDIEAESEEKAEEMTRDWGRDELAKDETNNCWDTEIWEVG